MDEHLFKTTYLLYTRDLGKGEKLFSVVPDSISYSNPQMAIGVMKFLQRQSYSDQFFTVVKISDKKGFIVLGEPVAGLQER